jgi:hypothetical protein
MGNEPCPFWEQNGSGRALSEGVTVHGRTALACGNVVQQRVCGVRAQFASRESGSKSTDEPYALECRTADLQCQA